MSKEDDHKDGDKTMLAHAALIEDFHSFRSEPSVENRKHLTIKICEEYNSGAFDEVSQSIVHDILHYLAKDIEVKVRQSLSEALKRNENIPHDIAVQLAKDVEEVAIPILEYSQVLTEDDLEEIIVQSREVNKLVAVAKRENVSERISEKLVDSEVESVVETLIKNDTARVPEQSMNKVVSLFGETENIMQAMVHRGNLSPRIIERLSSTASERIKQELYKKYHFNADAKRSSSKAIGEAIEEGQENVTLNALNGDREEHVLELVNHLYQSGKLSHSIVLRALCRADIAFFEAGLAKLAGIPTPNAHKLIYEGDKRGFSALFSAASMPTTMYDATEILLRLIIDHRRENDETRSHYARRLIAYIKKDGLDYQVPNMSYFMALINNQAEAVQ